MQVIVGVRGHWKTRWPEWGLALTMLGQSLITINGSNLHSNQLYTTLRDMIDVREAGAGGGIVGAVWLVALILNGTFITFRRISPWLRAAAGTICSAYWTFWAYAVYVSAHSFTSLAWFNYGSFAAMAAMCVFMAAGEVAHADIKARQWHRIRRRTGGPWGKLWERFWAVLRLRS